MNRITIFFLIKCISKSSLHFNWLCHHVFYYISDHFVMKKNSNQLMKKFVEVCIHNSHILNTPSKKSNIKNWMFTFRSKVKPQVLAQKKYFEANLKIKSDMKKGIPVRVQKVFIQHNDDLVRGWWLRGLGRGDWNHWLIWLLLCWQTVSVFDWRSGFQAMSWRGFEMVEASLYFELIIIKVIINDSFGPSHVTWKAGMVKKALRYNQQRRETVLPVHCLHRSWR